MDWTQWFQQTTGGLINQWGTAQFVAKPQLQAAQLQALNQYGQAYNEGQQAALAKSAATINPAILLIGGGVLLFLMLKD